MLAGIVARLRAIVKVEMQMKPVRKTTVEATVLRAARLIFRNMETRAKTLFTDSPQSYGFAFSKVSLLSITVHHICRRTVVQFCQSPGEAGFYQKCAPNLPHASCLLQQSI